MNDMNPKALGYVVVTDYIQANTGLDVSDAIQKIIDENPHRTIYFPDGIYVLSHPVMTPADPKLSVSLSLSAYAILKASDDWTDTEVILPEPFAGRYRTIGYPTAGIEANIPLRWNKKVKVERYG